MEKKTVYLIGAGVGIGALFLFLNSKKKSSEEAAPLYAGQAVPVEGQGASGEVALAEAKGAFEAAEAKQGAELNFAQEKVHAYESRPSGVEEILNAKALLEGLGLNSGPGSSTGSGGQQLTPASTTSSNSESGSHMPANTPPTISSSRPQPSEPVPNAAHEWHLSTSGGTAGKYYYVGSYNGKPVHIYHASNFAGAVGPSHNLVVV